MSTEQPRLRVGDQVPTFWARDVHGTIIDSNEFTASYTMLVFLRYAGCPLCNLAIYRLSREYALLQKNGCNVVTFVQSSEENIEKNIFGRHDLKPPFPVVADQDQDLYRLFGVTPKPVKAVTHVVGNASHWLDASQKKGFPQSDVDGNLFIVPALFLIDKNLTVRVADYSANFYDDETFTPLYQYLTFGQSDV